MAIDSKYGRVTLEHGSIGEDEPVVVFRATDKLLPKVLYHYYNLCLVAGSPERHLDILRNATEKVEAWQEINQTRTPNSENSREWLKE